MIRCIIVDDEEPAINVIKNYIAKVPWLELVGTTTNPLLAIGLIEDQKADLVFLDIQMDELTGIELKSTIRQQVQVIFCTAYSEFAVESYELNAVDYLVKPISFERFFKAVNKVKESHKTSDAASTESPADDFIFVKAEQKGKMTRINIEDIEYVEAMNNYISIKTASGHLLVYSTMKEIESRLPLARFVRIHKSFIIDFSKVHKVENNMVLLKNSTEKLPLSKTYRTEFLQMIKSNMLTR